MELLKRGGSLRLISSKEQLKEGGPPEGTKPFIRVNSDDTLAVPGSDARLAEGEFLIVVSKEPDSCN